MNINRSELKGNALIEMAGAESKSRIYDNLNRLYMLIAKI